jgi:hypothetical protein
MSLPVTRAYLDNGGLQVLLACRENKQGLIAQPFDLSTSFHLQLSFTGDLFLGALTK